MGQIIDTLRTIKDDLLTSWYFRIWFLLWIVCAITVFVCMGFVSHRSSQELREPSYRVWYQNASDIHYPDYQISAQSLANTFISLTCSSDNGLPVQIKDCNRSGDPRWCKTVMASQFKNTYGRINCVIQTNPDEKVEHLLEWYPLSNGTDVTPLPATNIWFGPNNNAWVMLEKTVESKDGHWNTVWHPTLLYHSTLSIVGTYRLTTLIQNTKVIHFDIADWYNGWEALGIIGGYTFSLFILHKIAMVIVGILLTNNSTFLGGNAGKVPYSTISHQNL